MTLTNVISSSLKRSTSMAGRILAVCALSAAAVAIVAPSAGAAGTSNNVNGCKGYWYNTSFHGYCGSTTNTGDYKLIGICDYQADYHGKWHELPKGYTGKFDYDECTFKVTSAYVTYTR
ncbi:hypothetical protein [Streptomyces sp. NPDC085540]|uniref:hypothetical protein n=1 Tax=Streptomyces sp. NPDC085540 TaxID=3365730 RepID=UPI0037D605CA